MKTLTLKLDDLTRETLSMKRLTEYLRELVKLYGHEEQVHFVCVEPGSALLKAEVEDKAAQKVVDQIREAGNGLGSKIARRAYHNLADMMTEDSSGGRLLYEQAQIIEFPHAKETPATKVVSHTSVQGRLYSVGGKDETVPVRLEGPGGETLHCETDIATATKLGELLFKYVRLTGIGEWKQDDQAGWKLIKLKIQSYQPLTDAGIRETIEALRSAGGQHWSDSPQAHDYLINSRGH